jgi:hypothetical protein
MMMAGAGSAGDADGPVASAVCRGLLGDRAQQPAEFLCHSAQMTFREPAGDAYNELVDGRLHRDRVQALVARRRLGHAVTIVPPEAPTAATRANLDNQCRHGQSPRIMGP